SLREGILREQRGLIDVDALQDLIDGDTVVWCDERRLRRNDIPGEIRHVLDARAVVPPVFQVRVIHRAADVAYGAVGLNRGRDRLVAELIAEEGGDASRDAGTERPAGDDADRRLAEGVELEGGMIGHDAEIVSGRETVRRVSQVRQDGAARYVTGRERAPRRG